jgi:hypothetical protein
MNKLAIALALSLASPCSSPAQAPVLAPATRIRYWAAGSTTGPVGEVLVQRGDSLAVRDLRSGDTIRLSVVRLTRLDVSNDQKTHGLRGAGYGLLIGAAGGFAIGASERSAGPECVSHSFYDCLPRGTNEAAGAIFFGLLGAGIGGIVGHNITTDLWQTVIPAASGIAGARIGFSNRTCRMEIALHAP